MAGNMHAEHMGLVEAGRPTRTKALGLTLCGAVALVVGIVLMTLAPSQRRLLPDTVDSPVSLHEATQHLIDTLTTAEIMQRDFLLTRDDAFAGRLDRTRRDARRLLGSAERVLASNDVGRKHWPVISAQAERWMTLLDNVTEADRDGDFERARHLIADDGGRTAQLLRTAVSDLRTDANLAQSAQRTAERERLYIWFAAVLCLAVGGLFSLVAAAALWWSTHCIGSKRQPQAQAEPRWWHALPAQRMSLCVAENIDALTPIVLAGLDQAMADRKCAASASFRSALAAAERIAGLAGQLRSLADIAPLHRERVTIESLLADLIPLLHRTLGEAVEIETKTAPGVDAVFVDVAEVKGALLSLAVNAHEAMPNGGRLTISVSPAFPATDKRAPSHAGRYVEIIVSDSGRGMPEGLLTRALDPFFSTKGSACAGLGLTMVENFARRSGGALFIDSDVGFGTTVTLILPQSTDG